jgi:hypothetical protein
LRIWWVFGNKDDLFYISMKQLMWNAPLVAALQAYLSVNLNLDSADRQVSSAISVLSWTGEYRAAS